MNTTEVEIQRIPDGVHRILVLAHEGLGGVRLVELLDQHEPDQGSEVFLLVPALSGSLKQLANDNQDEIAAAESDLQRLLSEVESHLRVAGGLVGDSDPKLALEDVLRQFAADEVIVVNPPESEMNNLEESSTTRALADVSLPVTVLHVPSP